MINEFRPVVLCVDDEPEVLAALIRSLRSEPIDVRTTTDPAMALDILGRERITVVMADQRMPGMTGAELLAAAREVSPTSARLLLTGHADREVVADCLRQRIHGLLLKPWTPDHLRRTLRTLTTPAGSLPEPPVPGERCIEVDCSGLDIREVCDYVALALLRPSCRAAGAVIVMENAQHVAGSVGTLFRRLWGLFETSGVQSLLIDRSGMAVVFWRILGAERSVVGAGITGAVLIRGDGEADA